MTDGQAYRWHSGQAAYAPPPPQEHYQIYEHQAAMRKHRESYAGETAQSRSYVLPGYSVDTVSPTALYQHQIADSAPAGEAYQQIDTQHHIASAGVRPANAHVGQVSSAGSNSGSQSPAWSARPVRATVKASNNSDDGYVPDSKRSSTDSGSSKKRSNGGPAPRKRVPASCTPCRKKKLRCNRSMPCSSCVERGEPEGCVWEGDATPLYTVRHDNDLQELRAQVDRLQGLLDSLTKATRSPSPPDQQPNPHSPAGPPPAAKSDTDGDADIKFNLGAQDLCAALSELALTGIMPLMPTGSESFAPGGRSGDAFIEEAKRFLQTFTHRAGLSIDVPFAVLSPSDAAPSPPDSSSTSSEDSTGAPGGPAPIITPSSPRPSMSSILPLLPSTRELRTAFDFYAQYVHWYCAPVSLSAIETRWPAFKASLEIPDLEERAAAVDPLFLAMILGICASGLASMTNKQAKVRGFVGFRTATVERWVRAASLSLLAGKFVEEPRLDGVRAAAVIASFYVFMTTGETISAGMSLLSLAVHAAFDLGLNRDPVQGGQSGYSFREREERRRAFWCLFALSMTITTGTGRIWSQFDLRYIDCKFPLDCHDDELEMDERAAKARVRARFNAATFQETLMTSSVVRAELALLVKKITDKAFGIAPCAYQEILELDEELIAFERSLPSVYMLPIDSAGRVHVGFPPSLTHMRAVLINLCLAAELLRLHRPFLVLATTDSRYAYSRAQCLKYAKRILAINATPGCRINWAGHNVKVISAAIVLGVDLLQTQGSEEDTATRALIDSALQQTETFAGVSSVCRKGGGVVRFLLQKIDEESAQREQPRRSKRSRTFDHGVAEGRQMRSLSDAFAGFERTPATTDDDAEPRRRRAARPPLPHSISDTNVPQAISPTEGILPGSPQPGGVQMAPSLSTGRQQTLRPESAHSAPGTPSEKTFPSYSTAPVGRQIAGLGRTGFGQSRSKLSAGPHSAGLSIEVPSPLMATFGNLHQRGPVSTSPPQYNMNVHHGSTTPAGPPPTGEDGNMYPFFPLPPRHDEQLMASGVAAGASEFDFLADTDLDRHIFA
ncbi:hypothetical protein C6P46_004866 [Rhodotorula mucilaginosa]|uniref:Zn(2)-C6 fungal-type domain-containing protein n=1 Tax=Rhodotorula mucilaginosa TaxID=5537 RepID=A0A9P6W1N4_RHOMI|nr:hypothetical protein C6P46_004866 [Rhodotorula mucilaginosa]